MKRYHFCKDLLIERSSGFQVYEVIKNWELAIFYGYFSYCKYRLKINLIFVYVEHHKLKKERERYIL